ncbi:unnamed protein product [Haemonchus placei]|uniref:Histone-lysine N-methyltransferase n=1 Tax=Haemonchus placei TaxID=6290 RepID=A0A3P7WY31_HAEPC|nr:unnamed protein product [Haemonchus placei]
MRVAALVTSSYFMNQPVWSTGTIGTLPNTAYDRNQDRVTAYVVATDRALCVLRFPPRSGSLAGANCFEYPCTERGHAHVDETIFRGSSRIHAVVKHFGSNNMSARRMAKNRSQFDVVQPGPCLDRLKTSQSPPHVTWQYHTECSPVCLGGLERDPCDPQFYKCSPLHIPILCGWRRVYSSIHVRNFYLLVNLHFLHEISESKLFKEVGSELTIDLFCFDPIECSDPADVIQVAESSVKTADFTLGLENLPIPAVNTVDDEDPPKMSYCARRFPYNHQVDVKTISRDFCSGCSCTDDCSDPSKCECQQLTVSNVQRLARSFRPSVGEYGYRTLLGKTITGVFECNDNCGCQQKRCYNRVVQQPIKYPIQIYKTAQSGWGVRALCDIPAGAFIANYVGALLTDSIADALHGEDEYFADLDLNDAVRSFLFIRNPSLLVRLVLKCNIIKNKFFPGNEEYIMLIVTVDAAAAVGDDTMFKWADYFGENNTLFVVDAKKKGNVGRFLNHSCDPNVQVQHVFVDTHDLRLPWSSFFAIRNIKAGEELCWNYGYSPDLFCKCGAVTCRGRLL